MIRGDVHAIVLPRRRGHFQHGRRYGVIVQADDLSALSTVIICPTSTSTPDASFHPQINIAGEATRVMCEMVGVVDARVLGTRVGHLAFDELSRVEEALTLVLELN